MAVSDKLIRILTVDDHPLLRDGIAALIEGQPDMELVAEAANGLEAIACYREIDVLTAIAAGRSNKTVASTLGIGEETVKMHVKAILAKLGANDRTHAVTLALKRGIIHL